MVVTHCACFLLARVLAKYLTALSLCTARTVAYCAAARLVLCVVMHSALARACVSACDARRISFYVSARREYHSKYVVITYSLGVLDRLFTYF